MDFNNLANSRYSVRDYEAKEINEADLNYILEAAHLAPSACNRQPWHFYICQSAESLGKVKQCYDRDWFATAPLVIVCCIDHDTEWVRPSDNHTHGIVDISIAAEHICLAATERGLGSCWVCNFDTRLCHDLLDLPDHEEAAVLIPIGYPKGSPTEKKRKDLQEIVTRL